MITLNDYESIRALYDTGRFAQVQALIEEALKHRQLDLRTPIARDFVFLLGIAKARLGDLDGAKHRFRQVLRFNPRHFNAARFLGVALEQQGRLAEAYKAYWHAKQIDPDSAPIKAKLAALQTHPDVRRLIEDQAAGHPPAEPKAITPRIAPVSGDDGVSKSRPVYALPGDPGEVIAEVNRRLSSYFWEWVTTGALLLIGAVIALGTQSIEPLLACFVAIVSVIGYIFVDRFQKTWIIFRHKVDHLWGVLRDLVRSTWFSEVDHVQLVQTWGDYFSNTARILAWADAERTQLRFSLIGIDSYQEMYELWRKLDCQIDLDQHVARRLLVRPGSRPSLPVTGGNIANGGFVRPSTPAADTGDKRPQDAGQRSVANAHIKRQPVKVMGDPGKLLCQGQRRLSSYIWFWMTAVGFLLADRVIATQIGTTWPQGELTFAALLTVAFVFLHRRQRRFTVYERRVDQDLGILRPKIKSVILADVAAVDLDQTWGFWLTNSARILFWADVERTKLLMAIEAIRPLKEMRDEFFPRLQNQAKRDQAFKDHGLYS